MKPHALGRDIAQALQERTEIGHVGEQRTNCDRRGGGRLPGTSRRLRRGHCERASGSGDENLV
jgi:hypothetical protein